MTMKSLYLFIALFSFSTGFASIGMGDWASKTPGGNEIQHTDTGDNIVLFYTYNAKGDTPEPVKKLKEWYFYNGHVVGILETNAPHYFTANETTGKVHYFDTEEEWKYYLDENALEPYIWTRWSTGDWLVFDDDFAFLLVMMFPLTMTLIVLAIVLLIGVIREFASNGSEKTYRYIASVICVLIFITWLSDVHPQSF